MRLRGAKGQSQLPDARNEEVHLEDLAGPLNDGFDMFDSEPVADARDADTIFDSRIDSITRRFLDLCYGSEQTSRLSKTAGILKETNVRCTSEDSMHIVEAHGQMMARLKKRRRPVMDEEQVKSRKRVCI